MFRYPDPLDDHRAWEEELARLEEQVPKCSKCKQPVPEDFFYEFEEGRPICAECLDEHHKKEATEALLCDYCGKKIEDEHCYENDDGEVFHEKCMKHFRKEVVVR